jgi:hypothetical protein
MEGYYVLYVDYLADDHLHSDVVLRRRFKDEPEAVSQDCLHHPVVRQLLHMQERLYRYNWFFLTREVHF